MNTLQSLPSLTAALKAQYKSVPKRYEMSTATLRRIEWMMGNYFKPCESKSSTLWGIKTVINEALPLNEIKLIYSEEIDDWLKA